MPLKLVNSVIWAALEQQEKWYGVAALKLSGLILPLSNILLEDPTESVYVSTELVGICCHWACESHL